jgi:hypothetical protein
MTEIKKPTRKEIVAELWRRGRLEYKMHSVQREMFEIYESADKNATLVWLTSRQVGKCLEENTLVSTPQGSVKIKDIQVGSIVYGYNSLGEVSPTEVTGVHKQGKKEVIELLNRGRVVAIATKDHRWLAWDSYTKQEVEVTTEKLIGYPRYKIRREYFDSTGGDIHEPHAYALGAMLGDGYGKHSHSSLRQLSISSCDNKIPEAVAKELGCYYWKINSNNFSYCISNNYKPRTKSKENTVLLFNHYKDWCSGKKTHEKACDYEVIKTWTRESQVRFIAGLIDTDGSISITGRNNNELRLSLGMQAESVISCVKRMILDLWQIDICYLLDNREKYKNGPVHTLYLTNNFGVKRILKEISPWLATEHKQYKPEYDSFKEYNHKKEFLGVVKGRTLSSETYDISVNNDTHLYCLANGVVTHNSTMLCLLATMTCIKKSNSIVKIVTDTKVHAQMILEPKFIEILEDCPEDLKPTYIPSKYMYQFPNGSQIQMAGTDGNSAERLRGAKSELVLVDEAAFCTNLEKVVLSILRPTTTHTGGKIILASSAPEDPDHDFTKFMERAELEGNLTSKTIYDNPLLTTEQVRNIINGYVNGINNPQFRREYLNIIEKNAQTTVFPEVNIDTIKEMTSNIPPMPSHYDCYVGMDLGFKDMTVIAFAHYDFKHNVLVFDGEIAKKGPEVNLKELPNEILAMEAKLYTDPITGETRTPSKRVSDIMPLVTQEIARNSGYQVVFKNADKQDRLTAINAFRTAFSEGRIKIHAGACPTIVRHLINCRWKSIDDKSDFARSPDDSHYDAAAAAYYLFRSVVWEKNPFPHGYRDPNRHYNTLEQSNESVKSRLSKIFKR